MIMSDGCVNLEQKAFLKAEYIIPVLLLCSLALLLNDACLPGAVMPLGKYSRISHLRLTDWLGTLRSRTTTQEYLNMWEAF